MTALAPEKIGAETSVDFKTLIRAIREEGTYDPDEVANEVFRRVSPDTPPEYFHAAVRAYACQINSHSRPKDVFSGLSDELPRIEPGKPRPGKSWKVAGYHRLADRLLNSVYRGEDRNKALAEFTVADCHYARDRRYAHADATRAQGHQFDQLANLLTEHGVEHVADLPKSKIVSVMQDAA